MKKTDLRVQKTYQALLVALYDLMCEKRFDDLTVTEICAAANIRNATFYQHFSDKYQLFSFMSGELFYLNPAEEDEENLPLRSRAGRVFSRVIELLEVNETLILGMKRSVAGALFFDRLGILIERELRGEKTLSNREKWEISALSGMIAALGKEWIFADDRPEKNVILATFSALTV